MKNFIKKILPGPVKPVIRKCADFFLYTVSWLLFLLSGRSKRNRETILTLKNKYPNRRCFIIGNGPSLTPEDLDTLYTHGEITFAANKIAVIFPKTNWRPTYYLVFDEYYQRTMIDIMSKTTAEKKIFDVNSFLWTRKVTGDCVFLRGIHGRKWLRHPRFSENIYKNIYDIATVTYDSMQLAVYMGFKEIYLLGMDNMYANDKNKAAIQYEMNTAYQYAGQYADAHGINIINATRGGYLEIFPRAEFARLF